MKIKYPSLKNKSYDSKIKSKSPMIFCKETIILYQRAKNNNKKVSKSRKRKEKQIDIMMQMEPNKILSRNL